MREREPIVRSSFLELYDRLGPRLLAYLARRAPDEETAADIWAETWAVAFESWPRLRSRDPGRTEAWVFGIARHQLAAFYRAGSIERRALNRLRWRTPPVDGALDEELERLAEGDGADDDVDAALEALSPDRRLAVELRIVEDREYREVAELLGCTEPTARAHVSRGLRRLARHLTVKRSQPSEVTRQ